MIIPFKLPSIHFSEKEKTELLQLERLVIELNHRDIPEAVSEEINSRLEALNHFQGSPKAYLQKMRSAKKGIFELLQKKTGLVPKNYYTNYWMPLGMTVFGLPLGTALFAATNNAAFIGIGLPLGLAIGSFYGRKLDKKATEEQKVLDLS